jgi:branched-chain amino acid transport system substrate-binding protein
MYQNDDYGKDYLKGLKDGLGAKAASMIVAEESYETSEPTIDTHIVKLKSTNADVFINVASPKFAAQAIKKMAEVQWKPIHFLNNVSGSIGGVITPRARKMPKASSRRLTSRTRPTHSGRTMPA